MVLNSLKSESLVMASPAEARLQVQFAEYLLDLRTGELWRNSERIALPYQSFQILSALLEQPGQLVTREELVKRLWASDVFVEFEGSLNKAIKRLRETLNDSADQPRFIETLPRRGYRFIAQVESIGARVPHPSPGFGEGREPKGLVGKKVSHYRVLEVIGGGGMGVVYRAEDLKLGRRVALKFLPEELGSDPLALERFSREACAASSLDHPNICTIFEVEEHDWQPFIVMQLLEGQTLRDRLAAAAAEQRALPIAELLDIGIQVSDGLQAAHEKGIVHRDIKPANIFLTSIGPVKILDFGLAKLIGAAGQPGSDGCQLGPDGATAPQFARSAHVNATLTRLGMAMGTAGYMSPEQIRGESLDARSDIFSFGLVLYEMATGQRAFSGESAAAAHDATLNTTPTPIRELNSTLSLQVEKIINKALERDRGRRYQSAAELGRDLQSLQQSQVTRSRVSRLMLFSAAAAVVCVTGFLLRSNWQEPRPAKEPIVRQLTPGPDLEPGIAISPDGKHLAYGDGAAGVSLLQIDTGENRLFPNTSSFVPKGWLADGDHLFLVKPSDPGTWIISTIDGTVRKWRDDTIAPLASPDGKKLAFVRNNEIWVMSAQGEAPQKIVSADPQWFVGNPVWSPTGQRIAYQKTSSTPWDSSKAVDRYKKVDREFDSCDLKGQCSTVLSDPRLLLTSCNGGLVWLPDGRIIFSRSDLPENSHSSNLWSLEVDPVTGRVEGKPKRLTEWTGFEQCDLKVSADGKRLIFQQTRNDEAAKIAEFQANGRELGTPRLLNSDTWWSLVEGWTPDSHSVLLTASRYGKRGIFKQNLDDPSPQPMVLGSENYDSPVITPDGQWLLYTEQASDDSVRLMRMPLQGGPATLVLPGSYSYRCASSPSALCVLSEKKGNQLIFSLLDPFHGRGRELVTTEKKGLYGYFWSLSSDGKNIALLDGGDQVRVLNTGVGPPRLVSVGQWDFLQRVNWSSDGSHLYISGGRGGSFAILETDLAGDLKILKDLPGTQGWIFNPIPSPDGRYLGYTQRTWPSSIVMLENF